LVELQQGSGIAQNVITRLQLEHIVLTLRNCKARIQISFKGRSFSPSKSNLMAKSISFALNPSSFLSSSSASNFETSTRIYHDNNSNVFVEIESKDIPVLRASINSYLRLADASYQCIAD
jgi:tRNA threonylcarbamoyladenosine modification (KEOPS) complex  Pcc1 subunit